LPLSHWIRKSSCEYRPLDDFALLSFEIDRALHRSDRDRQVGASDRLDHPAVAGAAALAGDGDLRERVAQCLEPGDARLDVLQMPTSDGGCFGAVTFGLIGQCEERTYLLDREAECATVPNE